MAPEVQEPAKVVDLMEALRRSLDSVSTTKKKTAKVLEVKGRGSKVKATEAKGTKAGGIKKVASR